MTPYEIELLLHFHTTPGQHENSGTAIFNEVIESFIVNGLVFGSGDIGSVLGVRYRTTDKGNAYVAALCSVPMPRSVWVGADGKTIDCGSQRSIVDGEP